MDYRIETRGAFCVMGQEVPLADTKSENVNISNHFWQAFNRNLRQAGYTGGPNWVKYALLQRRAEGLRPARRRGRAPRAPASRWHGGWRPGSGS